MNKETYLTEYPKHESMRENVKKDKNRLHFQDRKSTRLNSSH